MARRLLIACVLGFAWGCGSAPDPAAEQRAKEERQVRYQTRLDAGISALAKENYAEAETEFRAAAAEQPGDEVAEWQRKAADLKHKDAVKRHGAAMTAAGADAAAGRHRAARANYAKALEALPGDKDAAAGVAKHHGPAWAEDGAEKAAAKDWVGAIAAYTEAQKAQFPGAGEKLSAARDARRAAVKPEYDALLAAGKLAADAENYAQAADKYRAAETLVPGDETAGRLAAAALFDGHVARGQLALTADDPDTAVRELQGAAKLDPQSESVKVLLAAATKRANDRAYDRAMTAGRADFGAKRYDAALRAFADAAKARPDDPEARRLKGEAEAQIRSYETLISRAKSQLSAKQFDAAAATARQAGGLIPGRPEWNRVLSDTTTAQAEDRAKKEKDDAERKRKLLKR